MVDRTTLPVGGEPDVPDGARGPGARPDVDVAERGTGRGPAWRSDVLDEVGSASLLGYEAWCSDRRIGRVHAVVDDGSRGWVEVVGVRWPHRLRVVPAGLVTVVDHRAGLVLLNATQAEVRRGHRPPGTRRGDASAHVPAVPDRVVRDRVVATSGREQAGDGRS